MEHKRYRVNKIGILALFFLLGLVFGVPSAAQQGFSVQLPVNPEQIRLLPASAWPPPESSQEALLMKLSYLRGLMDALQYCALAPSGAKRVLKGLNGQDLHQLAAAIDRHYLVHPSSRSLPPAAVVWRILALESAGAAKTR